MYLRGSISLLRLSFFLTRFKHVCRCSSKHFYHNHLRVLTSLSPWLVLTPIGVLFFFPFAVFLVVVMMSNFLLKPGHFCISYDILDLIWTFYFSWLPLTLLQEGKRGPFLILPGRGKWAGSPLSLHWHPMGDCCHSQMGMAFWLPSRPPLVPPSWLRGVDVPCYCSPSGHTDTMSRVSSLQRGSGESSDSPLVILWYYSGGMGWGVSAFWVGVWPCGEVGLLPARDERGNFLLGLFWQHLMRVGGASLQPD